MYLTAYLIYFQKLRHLSQISDSVRFSPTPVLPLFHLNALPYTHTNPLSNNLKESHLRHKNYFRTHWKQYDNIK